MEILSRHCSFIILQSVCLYFERLSWHLQSPVLCKKLLLSLKNPLGWIVPVSPEAGQRWLNEQCCHLLGLSAILQPREWTETGADGWKRHQHVLELTMSPTTVIPGQTRFTMGTRERVKLLPQRVVGLNLNLFYERCSMCCRWVQKHMKSMSTNIDSDPLVTHLWEMKLLNWIL